MSEGANKFKFITGRLKRKRPPNKDILDSVKELVSRDVNNARTETLKELKILAAEAALNGTARSGIFVSSTLTVIDNKITQSCKSTLDSIEALQERWYTTYTEGTLESITVLVKSRYLGLIDSVLRNGFEKVVGIANPPSSSRSNRSQINLLKQRIPNMVNTKVKEIELQNKIKKDPPGVLEAKKANRIAVVALLVACISLIATFTK